MQQSPCQPLHQFRPHCSPCTETLTRSRKFESTIEDVEKLKLQINHIRELLDKQSDKTNDRQAQAPAAQTLDGSVCTAPAPPPPPPPPPTNPDHNVSLASVEEFMVDPLDSPVPSSSNHLNFQYQTVQL